MTRRYGQVIAVTSTGHAPTGFRWNGVAYRVVEVLATWHLRDRWWETGTAGEAVAGASILPASDRHYWRVRCASGLICEVYHDMVSDAWVLDCVYD